METKFGCRHIVAAVAVTAWAVVLAWLIVWEFNERAWRKDAISRGYAEWVVANVGTGKAEFRWVEPKR